MVERRWQYAVPDDILSHISDFLPLQDWISFCGVCRSWRKAPSCRSNITEFSKSVAWCMFYDFDAQDRDLCYFFQKGNPKSFSLRLPILNGATCLMSNYGWLLINHNNGYFLFNPFTLAEILLPPHPTQPMESLACQAGKFSNLPTTTKCVVFLLTSIDSFTLEAAWCRVGDKQWMTKRLIVGDEIARKDMYYRMLDFLFDANLLDEWGQNFRSSPDFIKIVLGNQVLFGKFVEELQIGKQRPIHCADWCLCRGYVHYANWLLPKFGEEFIISFSGFKGYKTFDDWTIFPRRLRIMPGTNAPTANASVIKAAWIDPIFPASKELPSLRNVRNVHKPIPAGSKYCCGMV